MKNLNFFSSPSVCLSTASHLSLLQLTCFTRRSHEAERTVAGVGSVVTGNTLCSVHTRIGCVANGHPVTTVPSWKKKIKKYRISLRLKSLSITKDLRNKTIQACRKSCDDKIHWMIKKKKTSKKLNSYRRSVIMIANRIITAVSLLCQNIYEIC